MVKAVDIKAELALLPFLYGRTQDTPAAEARAAFTILTPYRDGGGCAGRFSGESQWERHCKVVSR